MGNYRIGIDVGPTNLLLGLFDSSMNLIDQTQILTDADAEPDRLMNLLVTLVKQLLENHGLGLSSLCGVGAAFPSYMDSERGMAVMTTNMVGFSGVPVRDILSSSLGVPVFVDNDANAAAIAEHEMGAGVGHDDMIYAGLSTGIGGGLILNGKLYRGMHGMAGEIGHMMVSDKTGYPCACGVNGCLQSIASGAYMAKYVTDRIKEGEDSSILNYAGTLSSVNMIAVGKALRTNDALALEVVSRGADYIGRMFHNLNEIFDINYFVYGGGVTKLGSRFVDRMIAAYRHYSLNDQYFPASFVPSHFGDQAGMYGAALLIPKDL